VFQGFQRQWEEERVFAFKHTLEIGDSWRKMY